jgi:CheY-like chemotaxis protein
MREVRILVLEDDSERISWFMKRAFGMAVDFAKTVGEALELLQSNEYTQIFLDHDLNDQHYKACDGEVCTGEFDEETGFAVAKWLGDNPGRSEDAEVIVHTLNEPAAKRMVRELHRGRRSYQRIPFNALLSHRAGDMGRKDKSVWDY